MSQIIHSAFGGSSQDPNSVVVQPIDVEIPEGLPEPQLYRLIMIPVGARKVSKGGIFLPDDVIDAQNWAHQLYKVAAVGKGVFKGPRFSDLGFTEADMPKVGDLYILNPKQPQRFTYRGVPFVLVADDQLWARVDRNFAEGFKFFGFEV